MDRSSRLWLGLAALSGLMAIAAGAFGAHGVSDLQAKAWLETGGHYQLMHAAATLGVLALGRARWVAPLFLAGALVFSGTLYLMAFGAPHIWGAVTPIGGLLMMAGWAILAFGAFLRPDSRPR